MQLKIPGGQLDLSRPVVMGILNVTPDSFSDGGRYLQLDSALFHAQSMLNDGAAIIDLGAESTRPGSDGVPLQQELDRLLPVVEALRSRFDCVLSVDTMKPEVMRAAISAGAHLINDVNGLRADGALEVVRDSGAAACVMHMLGAPRTMQAAPSYADVVSEVCEFLLARKADCLAAGIDESCLIYDPGFGFGKRLQDNLDLLASLGQFVSAGLPMLAGLSRKSMFGQLLDLPVADRLVPSVVAACLAVQNGAKIVRVHDVRETVQALRLLAAVESRSERT